MAPNTAQINPQIPSSQPASHPSGNNMVLSNSGNLKPLQTSTNTKNSQNNNFDENSETVTKKMDLTEKRGPGRPKGSTNKITEQKLFNRRLEEQQPTPTDYRQIPKGN